MARWRLEKMQTLLREKAAREDRRIMQSEIADALGLHFVTVSRYMNGEVRRPDLETLQKFADYFGVPVSYFLEEDAKQSEKQNRQQPEVSLVTG